MLDEDLLDRARVEPEAASNGAQRVEPVFVGGRLTAQSRTEGRVRRGCHACIDGFGFDEGGGVAKGLVGVARDDEADFGRGGRLSVRVSVSARVSASVSARVSLSVSASVRAGLG